MMDDALRRSTLLLVDDEDPNLDLLEAILEAEGFESLVRTSDARRAMALFEEHAPDLVLLDLHMPHRNGLEILREIRERTPPGDYVPVLVLTADVTMEARERALAGGARDFLTKPFDTIEVVLRVRNLLETRVLYRLQQEARARAEAAEARSALLAEASRVLGASLDGTTTLACLARLLVPRLAEGCAILLREGERLVPHGLAHVDPAREPLVRASLEAGAPPALLGEALRAERPVRLSGDAGGRILAAPIRVQGETTGALVLLRSAGQPDFGAEEEELAGEVAARAGLAVENARLFARAEWATRARERMLSVVAHDLRNPLAVAAMYAEMLLSMLPPGTQGYQAEALESICQSTQRMQRMIEDLLDVSSLQQGGFALRRWPQPLRPLLQEAERMLRPLADARGIALVVSASDPEDRVVELDAARFHQVLSNLVGNALKFTPAGGRVTVSCAERDGRLHVSVADTGPGIPAEQLPHIFGAFWQAREDDRRGVGLGLWIARALVEAHGGQIWVDSREGEGATFHFTLACAPQERHAAGLLADAWVG